MATIQQIMLGLGAAAGGGGGDPYWTNVKLLASFEGADESTTFVDLTGSGTLTGSGGAKIDTGHFPNGALLLDGTSSGSRVTSSKASSVGTGPFTWEAYIRPTAAQTGRIISAQDSAAPNAVLSFRVNADGSMTWLFRNAGGAGLSVVSSAAGLIAMDGSSEYHVAIDRDGSSSVRMYIAGSVVAGPTTVTTNPDNSRQFFIGAFDNTQERFAGNIRWARVTEGVARYGGAFTPPTIPFPTS